MPDHVTRYEYVSYDEVVYVNIFLGADSRSATLQPTSPPQVILQQNVTKIV